MIEAGKDRYQSRLDVAHSEDDGKYAFKRIPPGRYVLIIRFDGTTNQTRPFPTIYYPGVRDVAQAEVFTIAEGQNVENRNLVLPPLPAEYEVRGTVLGADGKPVANAAVYYMYANFSVTLRLKVDDQGKFSFKAYEGMQFVIFASLERQGKQTSNWIGTTVGPGLEPLKIVLSNP